MKTDSRHAAMLARLPRTGEVKAIYVHSKEDEALCHMTRARETAMIYYSRSRKKLFSFLLRNFPSIRQIIFRP